MRRLVGWLLVTFAVLLVLAGGALAAVFGPDNAVGSGPHDVSASGVGFVTDPEVLRYFGPIVDVRVVSADPGRSLFLGVGHPVDVSDLMAGVPHTRVTGLDIPWDISLVNAGGAAGFVGDPSGLDWWLVGVQGQGSLESRFPLPRVPVQVVLVDPTGATGLDVQVTVNLIVKGAFVAGLALLLLAVGLGVIGWRLRRARPTAGMPAGAVDEPRVEVSA